MWVVVWLVLYAHDKMMVLRLKPSWFMVEMGGSEPVMTYCSGVVLSASR